MKTTSVSSDWTVIACTSAPSAIPSLSASQRRLPIAWRKTPPRPPSVDRTAPTKTCPTVDDMAASRLRLEMARGSYAFRRRCHKTSPIGYGARRFLGEDHERQGNTGAPADRPQRAGGGG